METVCESQGPEKTLLRRSSADAEEGKLDPAAEAGGASRERSVSDNFLADNQRSSCFTNEKAIAEGALMEDHLWNELYTTLLMADYEQCSRIIGQNRDALLPSINSTDSDQNTLLHICASSIDQEEAQTVMNPRLVKVVRNLQDMGIEITKNSDGMTPAGLFLGKGISPREVQELFPGSTEQQEKAKSFTFGKPKKVAGIW